MSKFLGIGVVYDTENGYMLDQHQTILELMERFGLANANAVRVPIADEQDDGDNSALLPNGTNGTPARPTVQFFQTLVGSLLWIARCT